MINNDNSQKSVSGGMASGGAQAQAMQDSKELSHLMTEIVNLAKTAIQSAHDRNATLQVNR